MIVGYGAAGASAARELGRLSLELGLRCQIVVVDAESGLLYSKVGLTDMVAGKQPEDAVFLRWENECSTAEFRSSVRVVTLMPHTDELVLESGEAVPFDRLLIATGADPVPLSVPGERARGVFTLRTMRDAQGVVQRARACRRAIVVGGGLAGLKVTQALVHRGVQVSVVVSSREVLSRVLEPSLACEVRSALTRTGVRFFLGDDVLEVLNRMGEVSGVRLRGGSDLEADMVIVCKGVRPATRIVDASGVQRDVGIKVGVDMATSRRGVYAAGDVAQVPDLISGRGVVAGLWSAAVEQGRAAARAMMGLDPGYRGNLSTVCFSYGGLDGTIVGTGSVAAAGGTEAAEWVPLKGTGWGGMVVRRDGMVVGVSVLGARLPVRALRETLGRGVDAATVRKVLRAPWLFLPNGVERKCWGKRWLDA